jgi:signal transduction histidine kinase/ActR/RegA family two-component response regulator
MVVEREVVGALQVQSQQSTVYTEEDARLLSAVANQVGLAVQNAWLLEQARDQAQRLQEVMESVPDGVLLVDAATGEVLLANPAGERAATVLAGVGVGERLTDVAERPWRSWLRPAPHGGWHEIVVAGPPQRIFELTARPVHRVRRTGQQRHGAEDGAPIAWVMVIRDVTEERLRAERAQQQDRLAAVGQLAAGIAHDFSNIMAVIVLYAQMSQTVDDVPEQVLARLKTIVDQARSASDLIQQILDFSRSSALERRRLDLTRFVKEQVKMLRRMVPEHIEVEMVYGPEEHVVHADATSIQQVVMNLAVNARDAMPQGGEFTLALDRIEIMPDERPPLPGMAPGEWVRLTATDTGVGIEPEVLPRIFDPFFTTKGQDGGTGLGLAQVHGIVKQHDGEIDVVSTPGEGTTFRLYLPVVPSKDAAFDENHDEDHLPQGEGETVLVVEDAMAARASLVESLRVLNYMPIEASNGLEALAAFEDAAGLVDLVLTDLVMPDMGGRDLVAALRDRGIQTPVILLSGHTLSEDPLGFSDEGVIEFIRKPVHLPALARVVARALGVS